MFLAIVFLILSNSNPVESNVIVTGANSAYFSGLCNLQGSVRFWCPDCLTVVFDLGLTEHQLNYFQQDRTIVIRHIIQPELLINLKIYAWKPVAILQAVNEFGAILWLDAGSTVTGPLTLVFEYLRQDGHFFVQGQDLGMLPWVHPVLLPPDPSFYRDKQSFAGNTQGYVKHSRAYQLILLPLVLCSRNLSCIAPPGSSLTNHRYDQAVLSLLIHQKERQLTVTPHTEVLAASKVQLKPCFQDSSPFVIWTSRQSENCYKDH